MFEFGYIWVFILAPLPFLMYWLLPPLKRRTAALKHPNFAPISSVSNIKGSYGAWVSKRNIWQWIILLCSWLALLTALASPRLVGEPKLKVKTARNFIIAADISFSMANTDWVSNGQRVTRWEGVKEVLREFIKDRKSDRLALVFFGTNAYLQAPLTSDLEVIDFMLDETDVGMAGQMTSIGKAIGYSLKVLDGDTLKQKVMLLLTDGQDVGRGLLPSDAAQMALKDSVKIYTIGIGEATGSNSGLDELTLKSIASLTHGEYFLAQDKEQLHKAYQTLNELEPVEYESEENAPVTLLYHIPLAISIALALLLGLVRSTIKLLKH